jgi:transcriptional/translational regulatory protein YebC/TACO1
LEQAMEHAIEAGAEDVSINEEENTFEVSFRSKFSFIIQFQLMFQFITDARDVYLVQAQLSLLSYEIVEAACQYRPLSRVKLPDDAAEAIAEMCDQLMGEPEVVDIVDNIE